MRRNVRLGGFAAAVSVIALVTPLMAMNSAQASIPKADLKIVKTVASHGPTIDVDPRLSETLERGNVAWEPTGAHLTATPPTATQCQTIPNYCLNEIPKVQIGEYVDTSTSLSDVVNAPAGPFSIPKLGITPTPNIPSGFVNMSLIVDLGNAQNTNFSYGSIKLVLLGGIGAGPTDVWTGTTLANGVLAPAFQMPVVNGVAAGTLQQWLTPFPDATVTAYGFSSQTPNVNQGIPPSVDLTINWIDFAGTRHDLARTTTFKPSISATPGDTVTYKLVVTNGSSADTKTATGVRIADVLPPEFTYVPGTLNSPSWPCAFTVNVLACSSITMARNDTRTITFDATLDDTITTAGLPAVAGHPVDVQHQTTATDLPAAATKTVTTMCPTGYLATDGGLLVGSIGQGADYSDIVINSSMPVTVAGVSGWRVQATNLGGAQAQGKATVTCLDSTVGTSSGHTHDLSFTNPAMRQLIAVNDNQGVSPRLVFRTCPAGYTPYAPAFDITDGVAVIRESYAVDNTWFWTVDFSDGTNASFGVSCLSPQTNATDGHRADLTIATPDDTIAVAPETVADGPEPCPDAASAIVGGYGSNDPDILPLGMDPLGDHYTLRFYNSDWDSSHNADIQVTCIGTTTTDELPYQHIVNTAYLMATTKDRDYTDNSSSADVAVNSNDDGTPTRPSGVTLASLAAPRVLNGNNKPTAITLSMLCNTAPACSFTVKGLVDGDVVATKTTSIVQSITPRSVNVPTTSLGKNLAFGDDVVIKIKTTKGTSTYTVGLTS